jgi:glucose/arabinose dehydrogenase
MKQDRPRRWGYSRRKYLAAVGMAALAGCSGGGDGGDGSPSSDGTATPSDGGYDNPTPGAQLEWEVPTDSPRTDVRIETLAENLRIPWDLSFTGDGTIYLTERTGRVSTYADGELSPFVRPSEAIDAGALPPGSDQAPWWVDGGEGGTLGVAVHPDFPEEAFVYVYYTTRDSSGRSNRVVRYEADAEDPATTGVTVLGGIPANQYHNGGRIRFGPDGNLWVTTGDAGQPDRARDPSFLGGKVLRVTPEGEPAPGNPDLDGDPRVFSYGHRNVQGIDWLPGGVPVASEHGPTHRDEVYVLRPGGDYGWDVARGGPDDDQWESYAAHDRVVPPLINTGPDLGVAPSGATVYTGSAIPAWRNRFLVGGLISQSLWVVTLSPPEAELPPANGEEAYRYDADWFDPAYTATAHRLLRDELGRVRHVAQSPSGDLYAITSNRDGRAEGRFPRESDDVLVRLTAA